MPRQNKDWIEAYLEYTFNSEPPHMYHVWSAISVISAVLQRKCAFPWGNLTFYPNMYVVLVGPSGKARKGTAMNFALGFLEDIGVHLAAESTTREALIRALADAKDDMIDPNIGESTMHSSLTIFSPELTVFLGYQNHQLLSDLTDWYDCRRKWIYRTKLSGTDTIEGVYVSLLGATTPELIRTSLPMDAIGGGLTSRIVYVYEARKGKIVILPEVGKRELELHRTLTNDLQMIHMLRGNFTSTAGFLEEWAKWYSVQDDNPPFTDTNFAGYLERRPNHIMKLSMIISASEGDSMMITEHHIERAIKILNMTESKMPLTFMGVGRGQHSDTMSDVLVEIMTRKVVLKSELLELFYRDADSWLMDKFLETFSGMKYITMQNVGKDWKITFIPREKEKEDDNG